MIAKKKGAYMKTTDVLKAIGSEDFLNMVMYYIDDMKIRDIAEKLGIQETTVKQRLFSARNTIRKEVGTMNNRHLSLKPIHLAFVGSGVPCGNDPAIKAERVFSQNLIYLCKDTPKTAKELSEELCVPMTYVEQELDIQCRGENGTYGMLRRLDNGKYTTNVLLVDYREYDEANNIYAKHLPAICGLLKQSLEECKEAILDFPYLSSQEDIRFILWGLISRMFRNFKGDINDRIKAEWFADVPSAERPFTTVAIAFRLDETGAIPPLGFYGCDGIHANEVGGYRSVHVSNIYGDRVDAHFHCGHNLSHDEKLLMVMRAIGGISVDELTEQEKEIAAKCIECGYLRKKGALLEPQILVIDKADESRFFTLANRLHEGMQEIKEQIARELAAYMKAHIPEHLLWDYSHYTKQIAGVRILSDAIEECIREGLLSEPKERLGAEGMLMIVEKD